jgi:predicted acylesterase/phospholipase RssA
MQTQAIYQLIRGIKVFDTVSDDMLRLLADSMSLVAINGGDYLMRQGEPADCLYILAHGRLIVSVKTPHEADHKIGEIGVGDIVGEMALLTDLPRSATVRAVRDCQLVKIDRPLFKSIIQNHTQAAMGVVSECVKRLLPHFTEKKHGVKTLCILPCDAMVDMVKFASTLCDAFKKYINIKILHARDPELIEKRKQDSSALYTWLADLETKHDLLVYIADHALNDFTKLALSQSDKLIRVTSPKAELNQELVNYVNQSKTILADKYLVVVHPPETKMPSGTAKLLAALPSTQHFHVAQPDDYQRVARYMLGRSVSVVFSGGGLRGIAHQGLITAFYERNLPIDLASGTSFGSLPAVFCGLKITPDEMLEVWKSIVEKIKKVVDVTLPLAAISKGEVLYDLLTQVVPPSIMMEDLWIPCFSVSTNISTFTPKMHTRGPAWEAIRASLSIPGIFPPVIDGDDVLVDGASMNNLPVDLMATMNNQGTIMASIASGKPAHIHYAGYDQSLSGWRMISELFHHSVPAIVPSIVETMLTASLAASTLHQERMATTADYTFDLGVDHYKLLDIVHWMQIRETGYQTALKLIDLYGLSPEKLHV